MVSDGRERENSLGSERKGQCETNAKKNGKSLTEARRHREKQIWEKKDLDEHGNEVVMVVVTSEE